MNNVNSKYLSFFSM